MNPNGLDALNHQMRHDAFAQGGPTGSDDYYRRALEFLQGMAQARIDAERGGRDMPSLYPQQQPTRRPNIPMAEQFMANPPMHNYAPFPNH
jgi:hypothetical protein